MGLHIFWPATTCLTLFVVCIIIVLLRYGSRICKLRHTPLPSDQEWEGKTYSRKLSVSMA
ncbi:wurmchen 2 transmembrane micropeptide [Calliopsis andreniformis]|uniref:wurmchen 2 transmembrane micropeptide n=1 Tax=Calliopsis andreniformis TaxID=337506 RepID=UPI003FCEC455